MDNNLCSLLENSVDNLCQPRILPRPQPQILLWLGDLEASSRWVRSQARESINLRVIHPSAPGRPAVGTTGSGSASKSALIPAKDADGKYRCPHCTKTYLHAKHLKRHLLRRESYLQIYFI